MQSTNLPRGIALVVGREGVVQEVMHDTFSVFPSEKEDPLFVDCLESDSISKGYRFLKNIEANGVAYGWELHVSEADEVMLFSFSGVDIEDGKLLIGTPDLEDTEQFLDGLMEMNNEQVNKLRLFIKEQQRALDSKRDGDWQMYDEMSGLNNDLANMQRKLTKKTAELERSNELKNQMLGMAAHDLRNPLSLILNYASFLIDDHKEESIFDEEQYQLVKEIKESSEYMVQIVEDMLDISTIESGSLKLEKEEQDLIPLVERSISLNKRPASKKDIEIKTELPESPLFKKIDPRKFQQVVDNLISNAVKFSHFDTTITVGISDVHKNKGIRIYVQDEGQGIPEDEIDDLFTPFSKISVEATAGEKSTGLGLAITNRVVEAHGGTIEVESEVGVGSTFSVWLP